MAPERNYIVNYNITANTLPVSQALDALLGRIHQLSGKGKGFSLLNSDVKSITKTIQSLSNAATKINPKINTEGIRTDLGTMERMVTASAIRMRDTLESVFGGQAGAAKFMESVGKLDGRGLRKSQLNAYKEGIKDYRKKITDTQKELDKLNAQSSRVSTATPMGYSGDKLNKWRENQKKHYANLTAEANRQITNYNKELERLGKLQNDLVKKYPGLISGGASSSKTEGMVNVGITPAPSTTQANATAIRSLASALEKLSLVKKKTFSYKIDVMSNWEDITKQMQAVSKGVAGKGGKGAKAAKGAAEITIPVVAEVTRVLPKPTGPNVVETVAEVTRVLPVKSELNIKATAEINADSVKTIGTVKLQGTLAAERIKAPKAAVEVPVKAIVDAAGIEASLAKAAEKMKALTIKARIEPVWGTNAKEGAANRNAISKKLGEGLNDVKVNLNITGAMEQIAKLREALMTLERPIPVTLATGGGSRQRTTSGPGYTSEQPLPYGSRSAETAARLGSTYGMLPYARTGYARMRIPAGKEGMALAGGNNEGLYARARRWAYPLTGNTSFGASTPAALSMAKGMGTMFAVGGAMSVISDTFGQSVQYQNLMETAKAIYRNNYRGNNFNGDFGNLAKNVRNVARKTKFTAPDAAGAARFMAMAGLDVPTSAAAIKPIADVAVIDDQDLATMADKMTNIMTEFKIKPKDMPKLADMLTNTYTSTNTNMIQLAEALSYGGGYAYLANHQKGNVNSLAEALAMIGVMGNSGIQGSRAGTTLRMMYQNVLQPTKKSQKYWDALGISLTNKDGSPVDMLDLIEKIKHNPKVNDKNIAKWMSGLFRVTATQGAAAATIDVEKTRSVANANLAANGIANEISLKKQNTVEGLWKQVESSLTDDTLTVFSGLQKTIKGAMGDALKYLAKPEAVQNLKNVFDLLKAILGIFKASVSIWLKIYNAFPGFIKAIVVMQMAMTQIGYLITPFVQMLGMLSSFRGLLPGAAGVAGGAYAVGGLAAGGGIASRYSSARIAGAMMAGGAVPRVMEANAVKSVVRRGAATSGMSRLGGGLTSLLLNGSLLWATLRHPRGSSAAVAGAVAAPEAIAAERASANTLLERQNAMYRNGGSYYNYIRNAHTNGFMYTKGSEYWERAGESELSAHYGARAEQNYANERRLVAERNAYMNVLRDMRRTEQFRNSALIERFAAMNKLGTGARMGLAYKAGNAMLTGFTLMPLINMIKNSILRIPIFLAKIAGMFTAALPYLAALAGIALLVAYVKHISKRYEDADKTSDRVKAYSKTALKNGYNQMAGGIGTKPIDLTNWLKSNPQLNNNTYVGDIPSVSNKPKASKRKLSQISDFRQLTSKLGKDTHFLPILQNWYDKYIVPYKYAYGKDSKNYSFSAIKNQLETDAGGNLLQEYTAEDGTKIKTYKTLGVDNKYYNGVRNLIARASVYRYGAESNETKNAESKITSIVENSKGKLSAKNKEAINNMIEQFNPALNIGKDVNNYGYKQIFNSPDLSEFTQWYSGAYNKLTQVWKTYQNLVNLTGLYSDKFMNAASSYLGTIPIKLPDMYGRMQNVFLQFKNGQPQWEGFYDMLNALGIQVPNTVNAHVSLLENIANSLDNIPGLQGVAGRIKALIEYLKQQEIEASRWTNVNWNSGENPSTNNVLQPKSNKVKIPYKAGKQKFGYAWNMGYQPYNPLQKAIDDKKQNKGKLAYITRPGTKENNIVKSIPGAKKNNKNKKGTVDNGFGTGWNNSGSSNATNSLPAATGGKGGRTGGSSNPNKGYENTYGRQAATPTQINITIQNLANFDKTTIAGNADERAMIQSVEDRLAQAIAMLTSQVNSQLSLMGKV
jgi:TP901 family phage tail tape measure protein